MSDLPRPAPSSPVERGHSEHPSLASELAATAHRVEQAVEERIEQGIEVAEQTIARRFGLHALRIARATVRAGLWSIVAIYFVFGALLLVTRYAVLPHIDEWRPQLEAIAARSLNAQVTIGRIDAGWRGFNPHLALNDVKIVGPRGGAPLALPRVDATVSWWSALTRTPRFTALRVLAPEITIERLADGRFALAGFVIEPARSESEGSAALDWLLMQNSLGVRDAVVHYRDERASPALELELRELNLSARQSFGFYRFALQARPTALIAGPLDVRGTLRTGAFARPSEMREWTGEVFAQLDFADLGLLARFVSLPVSIVQAQGAVRAWVAFDGGEIERSTADVALLDVAARLGGDLEPLRLASLQGRLTQQRWGQALPHGRGGQEYELVATTFRTASGLTFPPIDLTLRLTRASVDAPRRTELEATRIDLQSLAAVATQLPLPLELRDGIARHALRGTVSNVAVAWVGDAPTLRETSVKARFSGLSSAAQPKAAAEGTQAVGQPGFENLSGAVRMEAGNGTLDLSANDAALIFPGIFEEPRIPLRQLVGTIEWKHGDGTELRFDGIRAANDDAEVTGSGTWRSSETGPGAIDIAGRITRGALEAAHRYVPLQAGQQTRHWLERAVLSGRVTEGAYRMRGDLAHFPFVRRADGEFRIEGRVADASLDVHPAAADANGTRPPPGSEWPLLTDIDADVLFERASMRISAQRARAFGVRIDKAVARVDDLLHDATLQVSGTASGPLADLVRYVNRSPVARWIGGITEGADSQGEAQLDLGLQIPLRHARDSKVRGTIALNGNAIQLAGVPPLTRVAGVVGFSERGMRISNLSASALGGPVRIDGTRRADGAHSLVATGTATAAGLRSALSIGPAQRLLERAQGSARYQLSLAIKDGSELRVESDLVGLAIDGVAPLRKAAPEALPLRVERVMRAGSDDLQIQAGTEQAPAVAVKIERRLDRGELRFARGVVALGEAANLPEHGLRVTASVPRLDIEAWSNFVGFDPTAPPAARSTAGDDISVDFIALRAQEIILYGQRFRDVTFGATRTADGGYHGNLASQGASGFVAWRPAQDAQSSGQLTARLSRLTLRAGAETEVVEALRAAPKQIPSIELVADDFQLAAKQLGRLDVVAQNTGSGASAVWRVRKLEITNPDFTISASGDWAPAGSAARRVQMKFALDALDAGGALARFGNPGALSKGAGKLEGDVAWLGSPFSIDYPSLSGRVALAVDNGRFLKIDAGNAARLLALLSLQTLSRTVSADAGRQFGEGFAFASIRADATIERGMLKTDNLRMNGESAAVLMSGTIDLRNETQQLTIVVLPQIDATTAAVALGVANPVLGLGAFLAQLVLKDPLSKAFALQYDVAGSWDDPKITRRSRITPSTTTEAGK